MQGLTCVFLDLGIAWGRERGRGQPLEAIDCWERMGRVGWSL